MEVIYRKLSELRTLENNPRKITQEQLQKLKESIQNNPDYLEVRPIVLSDRTGELVIIDGNQRYVACLELGMSEVPCIVVDLDEEKARQYRIADNKTSEFATWDEDKLIRELRTMNVPMEMQDFFFEPIDQLLGFDVNFSPSSEYESSTEENEAVTQKEEISKEEAEAFKEKERKIEEGMSHEATEYIEMKCPHCGEIIRMRK